MDVFHCFSQHHIDLCYILDGVIKVNSPPPKK